MIAGVLRRLSSTQSNEIERNTTMNNGILCREEYDRMVKNLFAAHTLVCAMSDEDETVSWLSDGLPDGTKSVEDVMDLLPNDESFGDEYHRMMALFARMVSHQTAWLDCTKSTVMLRHNGGGVFF